MWKKIAVAGCTAALIGGAGTAALAATGASSSPSAAATSGASSTTAKHPKAREALLKLRTLQHATWVTEDKDGKTFTTHDAIRGSVTSVSPTSITVKAADNVSQTYAVNADTKVHTRGSKDAVTIATVKSGDKVIVAGTGTTTLTATQIVDGLKK